MPVCKDQLRDFVKVTLKKVPEFYSKDSIEMMLLISAAESDGGHWLHQIGGPAQSFWGVEPFTMRDNYLHHLNFLKNHKMAAAIGAACGIYGPDKAALSYNMAYALLHARTKLWRSSRAMPSNIEDMAEWYKEWYNTSKGKADVETVIAKYHHFVKK